MPTTMITNISRALFFGLLLGFSGLCFFIAFNSFSFSAIGTSPYMRNNVMSLAPEGWAFFTRNPREDKLYIYKKERQSWRLLVVPNTTLKYYVGLDRGVRQIHMEVARLLKQIKPGAWKTTPDNVLEVAKADTTMVSITNAAYKPICSGEMLFTLQPLRPWAWSQDNVEMPSKYVKAYVNCTP